MLLFSFKIIKWKPELQWYFIEEHPQGGRLYALKENTQDIRQQTNPEAL